MNPPLDEPLSGGAPADPGARLMLAWQGGDESAFERLVERYAGQVWALLTRFLGPVAGREDLVQEVFLRVVRSRDRYEPTAKLSTWLYRIVFHLCVNQSEREGRRPLRLVGREGDEALESLPDEAATGPEAGLEREDVVTAVRTSIARLPERQRMALILAKYQEMPYAEIAAVMGISEKAVKSTVHRARESLRAWLAPFLEEEVV